MLTAHAMLDTLPPQHSATPTAQRNGNYGGYNDPGDHSSPKPSPAYSRDAHAHAHAHGRESPAANGMHDDVYGGGGAAGNYDSPAAGSAVKRSPAAPRQDYLEEDDAAADPSGIVQGPRRIIDPDARVVKCAPKSACTCHSLAYTHVSNQ